MGRTYCQSFMSCGTWSFENLVARMLRCFERTLGSRMWCRSNGTLFDRRNNTSFLPTTRDYQWKMQNNPSVSRTHSFQRYSIGAPNRNSAVRIHFQLVRAPLFVAKRFRVFPCWRVGHASWRSSVQFGFGICSPSWNTTPLDFWRRRRKHNVSTHIGKARTKNQQFLFFFMINFDWRIPLAGATFVVLSTPRAHHQSLSHSLIEVRFCPSAVFSPWNPNKPHHSKMQNSSNATSWCFALNQHQKPKTQEFCCFALLNTLKTPKESESNLLLDTKVISECNPKRRCQQKDQLQIKVFFRWIPHVSHCEAMTASSKYNQACAYIFLQHQKVQSSFSYLQWHHFFVTAICIDTQTRWVAVLSLFCLHPILDQSNQ